MKLDLFEKSRVELECLKQARANELIAKGDGYTFIAAPRSPDLRHTFETAETPLLLW